MANLISISESQFESEVIKSPVPVLVDFYAVWCGPCKMMGPVLEQVADRMAGKLKIVKVDTDNNQALAIKYQISGIPCLILFSQGAEASRMVGYQSQEGLIAKLTPFIK